jgi:hypothetical protein
LTFQGHGPSRSEEPRDWETRLVALERRLGEVEQELTELLGATTPKATFNATPSPAPDRSTVAVASRESDQEQTVREYVERLLERIHTESGERTPRVAIPSAETAGYSLSGVRDAEKPTVESAAATAESRKPLPEPGNLSSDVPSFRPSDEPYAPRTIPPERLTDMAAIRELAHISAQAAIRSFDKARAAKQALDRLPVILVSLSCGIFLLFAAVSTSQSPIYVATGAAFLITIESGWHAVRPLLACRIAAQTAPSP